MSGSEAQAADRRVTDDRSAEADHQRLLDAIADGLADGEAGRVHPHAEVVARMRARFVGRAK